jgi:Ca2+-binding EF-hand superfamily protein
MTPKKRTKASKADEAAAQAFAEAFLSFDSDGDAKLNLPEFREFLAAAELDPNSAELAFAIFDVDKSGYLDFPEFVEWLLFEAIADDHPRAYFERAFLAFDADRSGVLEVNELEKFFRVTGVEDPKAVAEAAAALGGNGLNFAQLVTLLELPEDA